MAVEIPSAGRTRHVAGALYLERWIEANAGADQITADLNALDAAADSTSSGTLWFGAPSPGDFDPGVTRPDWYGREIRIPFRAVQASGQWGTLMEAMESFIHATFPGEDIQGPNRRYEFPQPSADPANPSKVWAWDVEFD